MHKDSPDCMARGRWLRWITALLVAGGLVAGCSNAHAQANNRAQDLRRHHDAIAQQLAVNPFGRPLLLESRQSSNEVKGEVYAVIEHPFTRVGPALRDAEHWCDILILHLNIKSCRAGGGATNRVVNISAGRKQDDPFSRPYHMQFDYHLLASGPGYLQVRLSAEKGPLGTSNYRIETEVAALDVSRSFLHMTYTYGYGTPARLAMEAYLATLGRDKIGFSVVGRHANGQPIYVDGVRGVIERNTMRYYLAIDAYLNSLSRPLSEQQDWRRQQWFDSSERYHRQLHEVERGEYLRMKREQAGN